jgi:signal transduction histidine kinase
VADTVAANVRTQIEELRGDFQSEVVALLRSTSDPRSLANRFDAELRQHWPVADIGFVVALDGDVLAPSMFAGAEARRFRVENDRFLCSRESVEVYWNGPKGAINLTRLDQNEPSNSPPIEVFKGKAARTVAPEKETVPDALASKLAPESAAFREIVRNGESGTFARFLQDELNVLFWYRPPLPTPLVFGARVNLTRLVEKVRGSITIEEPLGREISIALINAAGQPVVLSQPRNQNVIVMGNRTKANLRGTVNLNRPSFGTGNTTPAIQLTNAAWVDWKHPYVATEIGEALPHWEVAVYLMDPGHVGRSARLARVAVGLLIAVLVLAIAVGCWLVVEDLKRQLMLARQKTDFVSNVSHELKTPLTSIRMFSEMLAEGRVDDDVKRKQFLNIIAAETARLTRLINNVLDFARMERGEKKTEFEPLDLSALARNTLEHYRPQLEASGFRINTNFPSKPIRVRGDRDAISQVMLNLLSNAEKYSVDERQIDVALTTSDALAEWSVLDRGRGVPPGCEEKIFEQFFRAHDSLASGIQGSGLGLTLARRIAEGHGGTVRYQPREGGGSCFILRLPLEPDCTSIERNRTDEHA